MLMMVQLLCPDRHCILTSVYEEGNGTFLEACEGIEAMVGPKGIYKRQCMLCGSRDLRFEEARTKYKTMAEGAPHLIATMQANIETRLQLDAEGKTLEKL